jgi:hypothetical protein
VEKMADHAEFLLSPAHHDRFKQQALKRASAFDLQRVLPEYLRIYEEVMAPESVN